LLPTPTASTGGPEPEGATGRKLVTVQNRHQLLPTPTTKDNMASPSMRKWAGHRMFAEVASLPTPKASDADRGGRGDLLTVLRGYETKHAGTLPTPTARDWRSGKASDETHAKNARPLNEALSGLASNQSGRVNPRFLEWMMNVPIGWTELRRSETVLCRKSPSSSAARSSKQKGEPHG
jgi:hypothetical protein